MSTDAMIIVGFTSHNSIHQLLMNLLVNLVWSKYKLSETKCDIGKYLNGNEDILL